MNFFEMSTKPAIHFYGLRKDFFKHCNKTKTEFKMLLFGVFIPKQIFGRQSKRKNRKFFSDTFFIIVKIILHESKISVKILHNHLTSLVLIFNFLKSFSSI